MLCSESEESHASWIMAYYVVRIDERIATSPSTTRHACNAPMAMAGESSIKSLSQSVEGTNGGIPSKTETSAAAKMKRRHRKTSRAWGKSADNMNPNCSNANSNNLSSTSCTHHQQQENGASESVGAEADADQRQRRRSSFAASKKDDSERSEITSGTASTEDVTVSSSCAEHEQDQPPHDGDASITCIGNETSSPRYIQSTNGGGGKDSASSSICSSAHTNTSTRSARSSQPYSSRYSSSMVGAPSVHPLAIAHELEEGIVKELEEELSVLARKTRAASDQRGLQVPKRSSSFLSKTKAQEEVGALYENRSAQASPTSL